LNQKVLAMNEENKRLKFALATAERQLHEGRNELTSIVEGIMDVDTEVAALLLKQIQAQNRIVQSQDRDRESPLTVTDEILKSQLQNMDSNDGPSHTHSSASADTPERSFKSRLEKVSETFFLKRLNGGGDLDSDWEGSSTPVVPSDLKVPISNTDFPQIRDNKSQDIERSIENMTPTARSSDTGENNVHVIEEINAIKDDLSDSREEFEDSDEDEDFDTASVVYDFARPGTAPARSQSISSKYARRFITSRQSPHASNTNSSRRKPLATMEDMMNMDNRSILSASSRRDEAFENLRRRFQAFTTT
jgi:chromosome segregation ATPase